MNQITDEQVEAARFAAWIADGKSAFGWPVSENGMRAALEAAFALSTPPVGAETGEPVGWRPMKDAPRGSPIVIKQGQWVATVILNPPSEEGHWTDGDSVIHYNGNVLVSGFHGTYDGWLPAGSAPPRSDKADGDWDRAIADLRLRIESRVIDFRDMPPEEDEGWESWYFASYDMLATSISDILIDFGRVGANYRADIAYTPTATPERDCATEGCKQSATEYFEAGGVGSGYCPTCAAKVRALSTSPAVPNTVGEDKL